MMRSKVNERAMIKKIVKVGHIRGEEEIFLLVLKKFLLPPLIPSLISLL